VAIKSSLLIVILSTVFIGQTEAQHFPSTQYMSADGMPSNSVFDIAQLPSGMMWFMTNSGPTHYDGRNWYSFSDSLDLPTSSNSKIIATDSTIWVAGLNKTAFTIQYYQDGWTELKVPYDPTIFNHHIAFNVFKYGSNHHVIIGGGNHLFVYDFEQFHWSKIEIGDLFINDIHSIDEKWIISTSQGLWQLKNSSLQIVSLPYSELPSSNILTLDYKNDVLHLLGYNWYAEVKDNKVAFLLDDAGLTSSALINQSSLVVDQNGTVFFGSSTPARMVNHENNTWQNLLIKGKNVNIGSTSIFCDAENNLWVSDSRGLFKFNVLQFLNYNKSSGLADDEVSAVTQLPDSTMVLANPHDFNVLKDNQIKHYSYEIDKNLAYRNLAMEVDMLNNHLYVATNDAGLLVYKNNNFEKPFNVYAEEGLTITSVKSFKGTIYAAGNTGIYYVNNGRMNKLNSHGGIRNISRVGNHLAFLSHTQGVLMYDGKSFKQYKSLNFNLSSVYQAVVYEGDTILATRDGPGIIYENEIKHWDKVHIKSPLYGLLVDRKNQLWMGSDNGVYLYNGTSLKLYDQDEGLSGNEINRNALFEDSEGQVWIGTEKGVSVFRADTESVKNLNLRVDLTQVKINEDQVLSSFSNNILPYNKNNLHITFQCLSYVDEKKINFRYRINPMEGKWIKKNDASNDIILNNLESGNYQFAIQARSGFGEYGPITSFDFEIRKPFFMQWWFIVFAIVLLLATARTIFYFRYLILIRKQRTLKELVATRTQEITRLNEQLEEKVNQRTKELHDKNIRLEESAYINAHHLRGPLTKIMSAVHISEANGGNLLDKEMIKILKESVDEMDKVIYSINDVLKN
jgi:ligand-binding sensor domain-containing protein